MKETNLEEILAKLEESRPELERIIRRKPSIHTGRKPKILYPIPPDMDFTAKDSNTEYAVTGHFDAEAKECVVVQMLHMLGYLG